MSPIANASSRPVVGMRGNLSQSWHGPHVPPPTPQQPGSFDFNFLRRREKRKEPGEFERGLKFKI